MDVLGCLVVARVLKRAFVRLVAWFDVMVGVLSDNGLGVVVSCRSEVLDC